MSAFAPAFAFAGSAQGSALSPTGEPGSRGGSVRARRESGRGDGRRGGRGALAAAETPGQAGDARITSRTKPVGMVVCKKSAPVVRALRIDARGVPGDGLADARGHAAQLPREHRRQVDAGLPKADELAGHLRPVRPLHHHGKDFAAEMATGLGGRPTGSGPSFPGPRLVPPRRRRDVSAWRGGPRS